jgi:hypothetical protein
MMALLVESKKETCQLMRAFGYDPVRVVAGSLTPVGFDEHDTDGQKVRRTWSSVMHWPLIEAALERDHRRGAAPTRKGADDAVEHPAHYTSDPSGVECITITRHRNFNVGNALKYLWRAGLKRDEGRDDRAKQVEDLRKAIWYVQDEITRLEGER